MSSRRLNAVFLGCHAGDNWSLHCLQAALDGGSETAKSHDDLHQIEYRHHPTRDLFPVASSMRTPESLQGWHSRIQPWVQHPHNEQVRESVCYQVSPNGQAAIAFRYWDERAAIRADGSLGRPLVSRVLVGPASVLSAPVAVTLCRAAPP